MFAGALPAALPQAQPIGASGGASMDQAAFLKLMTAQLAHQDPFKPVDNTAMVAQMAQFSSVAGIAEMNRSLRTMAAGTAASHLSSASQLIGKSVLMESDTSVPGADGRYRGEVWVEHPVDPLTISLVDATGAVVHSATVAAAAAGAVPFSFLASPSADEPPDQEPLTIRVSGAPAHTASWLPVTAVNSASPATLPMLVTPLGLMDISAVRAVR